MLRFTPRSRNSLVVLTSVLLFLVGVQTGKSIERIDRDFPAPKALTTPTPTPLQSFTFKEVSSCGVRFLLPDTHKQSRDQKGLFTYGDSRVKVTCDTQSRVQSTIDMEDALSTRSAIINAVETTIYINRKNYAWTLQPKKTQSPIHFQATQDIAELVQRTLKY